MSSECSSLSSLRVDLNEPQKLHLVTWGRGSLAHWALFVPYEQGGRVGVLVHIGVESKCSGTVCKFLDDEFSLGDTHKRRKIFDISGASVSIAQLRSVANSVFKGWKYNLVTRNCQNFVLAILIGLNKDFPERVTAEAIHDVRHHGTFSTFLESLTSKAKPVHPRSSASLRRHRPRNIVID